MGQWYRFTCSWCPYTAEVSGGRDAGMSGYVHTAICHTCKPARLVDAPNEREPFTEAVGDVADYVCPFARTRRHRLVLWSDPGSCPRCGRAMTRQETTALWD
jgi:hypothetical protein